MGNHLQSESAKSASQQFIANKLAANPKTQQTLSPALCELTARGPPAQLLNTEEVAEMLGVSLSLLNTWRCNRVGIPFVKIGTSARYRLSDVLAYVEANTVAVGSAL